MKISGLVSGGVVLLCIFGVALARSGARPAFLRPYWHKEQLQTSWDNLWGVQRHRESPTQAQSVSSASASTADLDSDSKELADAARGGMADIAKEVFGSSADAAKHLAEGIKETVTGKNGDPQKAQPEGEDGGANSKTQKELGKATEEYNEEVKENAQTTPRRDVGFITEEDTKRTLDEQK